MPRQRGLAEEDLKLWVAYSRTLTRLMPGHARLSTQAEPPPSPDPTDPAYKNPPGPAPAATLVAPTRAASPLTHAPTRLDINAPPNGLDKSTWAKFRQQKIRVEARLDLHGHTALQAHGEVLRFLHLAHESGLRCVEIITGNGEILARELPHWLNAPSLRPLILSLAHPHVRNRGSVRVLLKRRRP